MSKRAVNLLRKMEMVYGELQRFTNTAGIRDARLFRSATSGVAKTVMTATTLPIGPRLPTPSALLSLSTTRSASPAKCSNFDKIQNHLVMLEFMAMSDIALQRAE